MRSKNTIKFYRLYSSFSEADKKEFKKFTALYSGKENRNYTNTLNAIESKTSEINQRNKKDRTLWNRYSELYKIAEKFIVDKITTSNKPLLNKILMEYFLENNLDNLFKAKKNQVMKNFKKNISLIPESIILSEIYTMNSIFYRKRNDRVNYFKNYNKSSEIFMLYFLMKILLKGMEISHQVTNGENFKSDIVRPFLSNINMQAFLDFLKQNFPEYYPHIALYFNLYMGFETNSNTTFFFKAKNIFLNELKGITREDRKFVYNVLIEQCINYKNHNLFENDSELFSLIKKKLKEGFDEELRSENFLTNRFIDFVSIAISLNKVAWTKSFIRKYSVYLPEKYKDNEVNLAMAMLKFKTGELTASKEFLKKLGRRNYIDYFLASKLLIRIYFLENNFEDCLGVISRLKKYASNHPEVAKIHLENLKSFLTCITALIRLKVNNTVKEKTNLEFILRNSPHFPEKEWLLIMQQKNHNS